MAYIVFATCLVVLFNFCATADILAKLLQQCFLFFIVVVIYLGNSQVSVYRTSGPTLVENLENKKSVINVCVRQIILTQSLI